VKHLAACLTVLALVALFVPQSAEAKYTIPQKVYPTSNVQNAWQNVLALETLSTVTFSMQPYDQFWMFAAADSMGTGGADTIRVVVQYRWRHCLNIAPAVYYYGAWTVFDTLKVVDTLYSAPLWAAASWDTMSFYNDLQVRAYGKTDNDSSMIRVYVQKRRN